MLLGKKIKSMLVMKNSFKECLKKLVNYPTH